MYLEGGNLMYDYHVHSDFSEDCEIAMPKFVEQAIKLNISEICFTDHVDYDYTDPTISFNFDPGKRLPVIKTLRKKHGDKIEILNGIEIGVQPHIIDRCQEMIEQWNFDFVIASMHTSEKSDLYNGDFFKGKTPSKAYEIYLGELYESIRTFKSFSVIGHIDIPGKYQESVRSLRPEDFFGYYEMIFKKLVEKGKGIEVNTSAMNKGRDHMMPSLPILKLYKSLGGEVITLGSDSHIPATLAFEFDYVREMLIDLGFKYVCTFRKGKPIFNKL